ncbi:hypothetical protein ACFWPH_33515 [Nocardia sp. NPDC058499]|uniref:hypothetical protein n=1 Tax=Nocardia sp. NPDC058499 TaxID=3346530 RepID=UPI00364684DA
MILDIWWPTAAPQIFGDDHAQHYALEFRNFIQMAAMDVAAKRGNAAATNAH